MKRGKWDWKKLTLAILFLFLIVAMLSPKKYTEKQINEVQGKAYDSGYLNAFSDMTAHNFTGLCNQLRKNLMHEEFFKFCDETDCIYYILAPTNKTNVMEKKYEFYYPQISGYCRNMESFCKKNNFTYLPGIIQECFVEVRNGG